MVSDKKWDSGYLQSGMRKSRASTPLTYRYAIITVINYFLKNASGGVDIGRNDRKKKNMIFISVFLITKVSSIIENHCTTVGGDDPGKNCIGSIIGPVK